MIRKRAFILPLLLVACATSPTGRKQLHLLPSSQMDQLGVQAFQQMKAQTRQEADPQTNAFVHCVADAIVGAIPSNLRGEAPSKWEVVVFEDETPNAFALPGGKIGVHTGMMKLAKTDAQLAAVIGHEVGHVLAEHGNERVSQGLAAQSGMALLSILAATDDEGKARKRQLLLGLIGLGAQVGVLLPFSRTHESEADQMGIDLMARAGFNPQESVTLWENMEKAGGQQPPEFLSTHPSHGSRIAHLKEHLKDATPLYQDALAKGQQPRCARQAPIAALQ
jgi:predicted Zn-dependent protease